MTTIMRAEAAHDFLALVPALAGVRPRDSLVCVAFRGNRSCGAFRVDLPRAGADLPAFADTLVGLVCRVPGADGLVPVVYTDATFAAAGGMPERALAELIVARAAAFGFVVRDALCQAADGWGSYLDGECPGEGRPLDLLAASALAQEAGEPDGLERLGALPDPDGALARRVERSLLRVQRELAGEAMPGFLDRLLAWGEIDPVSWVEHCLDVPAGELEIAAGVWLIHLAQSPAQRDQMMLQFAFGELAGIIAEEENARWLAARAETGDSMDELAARDADGTLAQMALGRCRMRPDVSRTIHAIEVLRRFTAHAPAEYRPAPLCMLAWLNWALGRGSAAGALLDAALEIEPGHGMAEVLREIIGRGALPEWVFHPDAG